MVINDNHYTIEHRQKISESLRRYWQSPEARRKQSEAAKARLRTPEGRAQWVAAQSRGTEASRTPEARQRLSQALKGRHIPKEQRRKISEATKGRIPHNKGKHHTEETKQKISAANKGRVKTMAERQKISVAATARWQDQTFRQAHTGENLYNWKGGHKPYYGEDWQLIRKQALARDGHQCFVCGRIDHLGVHHHKPVRCFDKPNDANTLGNVVTLCVNCHHKAERMSCIIFDKWSLDISGGNK